MIGWLRAGALLWPHDSKRGEHLLYDTIVCWREMSEDEAKKKGLDDAQQWGVVTSPNIVLEGRAGWCEFLASEILLYPFSFKVKEWLE